MSSNPRIPYRLSSATAGLPGPGGKNLIVHLVVNVEAWQFDAAMPRKILPAPHGLEQVPDVPNFSWAEYGMRCGMPRILDMFAARGVTASTSINAGVIELYRECALAMREAGWEFIGHGMRQKSIQAEADEAGLIGAATETLEAFTGKATRGWLGPGLRESAQTPDLLKAAGLDYVCDWVLDDVPVWMRTAHGSLIAMPYSLEINDSVVYAVEKHAARELHDRARDALAALTPELQHGARVFTVGLHPHLIGVPHRIGTLARILDDLQDRPDTVFMTGSQIADWYRALEPEPR
jgi:peptidoglycan/xylan/chitin deacetylase (PgdA/CDA1 family)